MDAENAATKSRFENGAFIRKEKRLSDSEVIKYVVLPGELGDVTDTRCLIYTNSEFKQAAFICPDVKQSDLEEIDPRGEVD